MGKRRQFSAEFKRQAVALTAQPDVSVVQVARGHCQLNAHRRELRQLSAAFEV